MNAKYLLIGGFIVLLLILSSSEASASWLFGDSYGSKKKPKPDTQGG